MKNLLLITSFLCAAGARANDFFAEEPSGDSFIRMDRVETPTIVNPDAVAFAFENSAASAPQGPTDGIDEAVPEPASLIAAGAGLLALAIRRKRR